MIEDDWTVFNYKAHNQRVSKRWACFNVDIHVYSLSPPWWEAVTAAMILSWVAIFGMAFEVWVSTCHRDTSHNYLIAFYTINIIEQEALNRLNYCLLRMSFSCQYKLLPPFLRSWQPLCFPCLSYKQLQ